MEYDRFIGLQCAGHLEFWKWDSLENTTCIEFFPEGYKMPGEKAYGWKIRFPFICVPESEVILQIVGALMERLQITFAQICKQEPLAIPVNILYTDEKLYIGGNVYPEEEEATEIMKQALKLTKWK